MEAPHYLQEEDVMAEQRLPTLSSDYFYMGMDDDKGLPLIASKAHECGTKFAHLLLEKGPEAGAVKCCKQDIDQLGWKRMIWKSDNEPSIVALKRKVVEELPGGCHHT